MARPGRLRTCLCAIPVVGLLPWLGGCGNTAVASLSPIDERATAEAPEEVSKAVPPRRPEEAVPQSGQADSPKVNPRTTRPNADLPFPDRKELFLPPAHEPPQSVRRSGSSQRVVLMGFAGIDEEHAVLSIDGVVAILKPGQSQGDLRVIAVQPPQVVLQLDEREWSETLLTDTAELNQFER